MVKQLDSREEQKIDPTASAPTTEGKTGAPRSGAKSSKKPASKIGKKSRTSRSKSSNSKNEKVKATEDNGRPSSRSQRPFPARPLEEALTIPQAIRQKNNGNDWDTEQVAKAVNLSKTGVKFFYLAASARDYGLTVGSRDTEKIALAPIGRAIVFAGDEQTARQKRIEAFFSVDIFKKVYNHYGSGKLPEDQYLNNVLLSDFGLATDFHADFRQIFETNCKFLGIENGVGQGAVLIDETRPEHGADIRVIGEAKGKFDRTAFVIMPFIEKGAQPRPGGYFKEVLTKLITPAANQAGFAVETAEQDGSDVIQSTIINQLLKADSLVIADLTDHNPNVLFELGIRIAKELPVALIKAAGTGAIFDVDNMMRVLPYSQNLWPSTVEEDLPKLSKHIKAGWDNRQTGRNYMQILTNKTPQT
jgi:hypothetical protein